MDSTPEFLELFIDSTGELLYFLGVIAISQAALLIALEQRLRGRSERAAGRYVLLLAGVVLAWVALMGGALYTLATDTAADAILPPLERAINVLVIIFAGAGLLAADSPRPERRAWQITAMLAIVTVVAYGLTAAAWAPLADTEQFNEHALGFAWTFAPGLLLLAGMGLLLTRYRETADIPLKLVFGLVLLAGYTYTTVLMSADELSGDVSGALRLAFLVAMAMVAAVVYRLVLERLNAAIDEVSEYAEAVSRPQLAVGVPPEGAAPRTAPLGYSTAAESVTLLRALGLMLEHETPENIPRQIVEAVATVLKADVSVLLSHDDGEWADVVAAYSHIQERQIAGLALNLEEQPTLVSAIEGKMQRPLYPDRNLDELVDLYTRLDINQIGPAYIQPLTRSGEVVGVLIAAQPYTSRELSDTELTLLEGLGTIAARLLMISRAASRARYEAADQAIQELIESGGTEGVDAESALAARREMQASLETAQRQIADLSRMVRDLQVELDYERSRMAQLLEDGDEALTISQRIQALSQERMELAAERELLAQALQEAQATLVSATGEGDEDVYATMIDALRRERDELQVQKTKLERHLEDVRAAREQAVPGALKGMLEELSEDKARLSAQRDELQSELEGVRDQLRTLGIEGGAGAVAETLNRLNEERAYFKTRAEKIAQERDRLLAERTQITEQIEREAEREAKLDALENDLRRLATDREALIKQRDSMRAERDDLLHVRETWVAQRARILGEVSGLQAEMDDMISEMRRVEEERKRVSEERARFEAERDRLLAEHTALQTERDQLMARVEGNRDLLEQLGADGLGALKTMIDDLTAERQSLESQLAETQRQLAVADREATRPLTGANQASRPIAPANTDVVMSIAQELRTPMSSIMGYTDLLLTESVGILGALQRQFLQRVQANINRLHNLIEDLVNVTALDSADFRLQTSTIDMLEVVEDAITEAGTQFREKNITLHMRLPHEMPHVRADRDAMHQVIIQLLSNAYLASPINGEVTISAQEVRGFTPPPTHDLAPPGEPVDAIYVAVTDQGGGVPPDEQRRVFGRLYRADNPLIEGLGDTGVGLSIAKTLVEAHDGHIWLESEPGHGSIFQFIIPLADQPAGEEA